MNAPLMSVEAFQDGLDQYGEDLAAWPGKERARAKDLLAASEAARAVLAEACAQADALRASPPKAPAGLVDRILNAAGVAPPAPRRRLVEK